MNGEYIMRLIGPNYGLDESHPHPITHTNTFLEIHCSPLYEINVFNRLARIPLYISKNPSRGLQHLACRHLVDLRERSVDRVDKSLNNNRIRYNNRI